MKICSICHKISGTNEDHLDCVEKRRVDLMDEDLKRDILDKLDMVKNSDNLAVEVKAILDHLVRQKEKS